jgi:hypothetical protein
MFNLFSYQDSCVSVNPNTLESIDQIIIDNRQEVSAIWIPEEQPDVPMCGTVDTRPVLDTFWGIIGLVLQKPFTRLLHKMTDKWPTPSSNTLSSTHPQNSWHLSPAFRSHSYLTNPSLSTTNIHIRTSHSDTIFITFISTRVQLMSLQKDSLVIFFYYSFVWEMKGCSKHM